MIEDIICIVGPTASGKTGLGIELAKKIDAEIISADSMQIYKNLNVGTAKVTKEEAMGIPHHLIDICDIEDSFSVADFKNMCYEKIEEIRKRGKNVIIVGGTGLYVSSVVYDMHFGEENIDFQLRRKLEILAKEKSNEYVHDILKKIDPESANSIHPNNLKRVIRAIEIAKNTGNLKSKHMENEKRRIEEESRKYKFSVFFIDFDRDKLYQRINCRVDTMVKDGVLKEAKLLYDMNLPKDNTCIQAIGYKEFFPYFDGKSSLEECIENLKKSTRNYAKRQITWFKNKLKPYFLNGNSTREEMIETIIKNVD